MSSALWKTLLALFLVGVITVACFSAHAQEMTDEDDSAEDDIAAAGAGGAGEAPAGDEEQQKPLGFGLHAFTLFPKNMERKTPAGEKVDALVVVNNIAGNPEYNAVFIAAHLSPLGDHSRYYQNFSGNAYKRALVPGEATTLKYSFTPDVNAEPMEFALVVRVFIQPSDDANSTFAYTAYNASMTVTDPLGTDPKTVFTIIFFGGVVAAIGYWVNHRFLSGSSSKHPSGAPSQRVVNELEIKRDVKVDADFLPSEHLKYVEKLSHRGRSGSPNKK